MKDIKKNRQYLIFNRCVFVVLLVLSLVVFSCSVSAKENADLPEEYYGMLDSLPEDVADKLPDGMYSDDGEAVEEAVLEMTNPEYIFSFIGDILGEGIGGAVRTVSVLCGVLIISAVFSAFKKSLQSEVLSRGFGFCTSCVIFSSVISLQYAQIDMVVSFFERLNSLFLGMIPVMGALYAFGGNVSTAIAGNGTLYVFLAVSERICAATVVPVSTFCIALALCRGVAPDINLQGISSGVKKCYVFLLGFIMTVLTALLAGRTSLSAASDSTAARAAKLVASSVIPHVGASVSDTLRTVAASVQYMKGIVGVGGISFILLLLLPTLISLLLNRLAFLIAGAVADLLGCESESRLIGELGGVYGCMIAAVSMTSVMFILALNIFMKTAVAIL